MNGVRRAVVLGMALTLLASRPVRALVPKALEEVVRHQSAGEFLEMLSSEGVSGGAYLSSALDAEPPRPVPMESSLVPTIALQDIVAVWSASHPGWTVALDEQVVSIAAPGLSGPYRQITDVMLEGAAMDAAVNALMVAVDPSTLSVYAEAPDSVTRITLDPRGMNIVAVFNAVVRQVPGATWTFVRHAGGAPYGSVPAEDRGWASLEVHVSTAAHRAQLTGRPFLAPLPAVPGFGH